MNPPPKLTQEQVNLYLDDFYEDLIPADKMLERTNDLYWLYGVNRYVAAVRGPILGTYRRVLEFNRRSNEFWTMAPKIIQQFRHINDLNTLRKELTTLGFADQTDYDQEMRDERTNALELVNRLQSIKNEIDQWNASSKAEHDKIREETGVKVEKLINHVNCKMLWIKIVGWFYKFVLVLAEGWLAWKMEGFASFVESFFSKQSWLPSPFKEHILFFIIFYILDLSLDKPKEWFVNRLRRNLLAKKLGELWFQMSEDDAELKLFCQENQVTKEELDQILLDRLWEPKPFTV